MRDFLPFLDFIKRYLQTQSQVTTLFGMLLKLALAHAITKVELINENLNDVTLVIHHPFRINLQPAFFFPQNDPTHYEVVPHNQFILVLRAINFFSTYLNFFN